MSPGQSVPQHWRGGQAGWASGWGHPLCVWWMSCLTAGLFWAPLQSGCQHPPPARFLWILIYTSGPLLPVWATRPEEPHTCHISRNCDAKPRTLLNSARFSTVPHVMDPDRAPFSCSSWYDWIGRAKLACKWWLWFLYHDRAIVEKLWGMAATPVTFIVLDIPDVHLNLSLLPLSLHPSPVSTSLHPFISLFTFLRNRLLYLQDGCELAEFNIACAVKNLLT